MPWFGAFGDPNRSPEKMHELINDAVSKGAKLACGGDKMVHIFLTY